MLYHVLCLAHSRHHSGHIILEFVKLSTNLIGLCVKEILQQNLVVWSQMNIFLTNLACADLLVLIFCLPPTVINDVTKTFWFSTVFCKSILFFQVSESTLESFQDSQYIYFINVYNVIVIK
uniref:G_PROTEIN_RECEP_F1_2 domain-containing protein n=1 Tax=Heterorhabditis bacteriophora TaxID=37862 RepID=A0A1I7WKG5_HETBA